jgi:hypothetical protein
MAQYRQIPRYSAHHGFTAMKNMIKIYTLKFTGGLYRMYEYYKSHALFNALTSLRGL